MKKLIIIFLLFIICTIFPAKESFSQKSVYVIADINASGPTPIQAYSIQGNSLVLQAEYGVPNWGNGAVGLAIDPESAFLFITYEDSNIIQLLDGTSMADEGTTSAPGAENLAGIAYDNTNHHLYTMDRGTTALYSYIWDSYNKVLTLDYQKFLTGASAYGIFLDEQNGLLYVANGGSITYYSTTDWSLSGTYDDLNNGGAINVEKDIENNYLYYGGAFISNEYITKYDLNSGYQTDVYLGIGEGVMGITIDQQTGMVYITTGEDGDRIVVFNKNLSLVSQIQEDGDPTDIITGEIAYNPLNFMVSREFDCVVPGKDAEFSLCYENAYPTSATDVEIVAKIPQKTTYVSSSDSGVYNSAANTVTWNIGEVPAQTPQTCVTLVLNINQNISVPSTLLFNSSIDAANIGPMNVGEIVITDTSTTCPIPYVYIEADTSICEGDTASLSIFLSGISPWDVIYSYGTTTDTIFNLTDNIYILKVSPEETTTYSLVGVVAGNGMTNTSNGKVTVTVNPHPDISLGNDTVYLQKGQSVTLTPGSGFQNYLWQDGTSASQYNTSDTGIFWVRVTDMNNCKNSDTTHIISIDMYIPNAFTPNNDGINDKVFVRGDFFNSVNLKIFNRLGEMVFETTDQSLGWDGTFNGKEQDMGVFYYYFTGTLFDGRKVERTGNITLIR